MDYLTASGRALQYAVRNAIQSRQGSQFLEMGLQAVERLETPVFVGQHHSSAMQPHRAIFACTHISHSAR